MEGLQHLERGGNLFLHLRREHTLHSGFDLVDSIVDDRIDTDIHLLGLGHLASRTGRTNVEAHDDGIGSGSEHDVGVADGTYGTMDDVDLDILGGELDERVLDSLDGTVHIGLDDDVEFLEVSDSQTATDLLESDVLLGADRLLALQLLTLVSNLACLLLGRQYVELVTGLRRTVETEDRTRLTRANLLDALAALVEHGLDTTVVGAGQHDVAHMERTVLDEQRSYVAASLVERGLDDRTLGATLGIGLEVEHLGLQEHFLQQLVNAVTLLSRDLLALVLTAPVLDEDVHVGELLTDLIGVSTRLIHLVDSEYHRYAGRLGMVDRLDSLRHDGIVGRDDDDGYICHLGTTGTHSGKGRVTRRIEEGDMLAILELDVVGTDVLGDTTGLTGDDVSVTDVVEQRGLTVIDVTHDGDDWAARLDILLIDHLVGIDLVHHVGRYILGSEAELLGHEVDGLGIETLVD